MAKITKEEYSKISQVKNLKRKLKEIKWIFPFSWTRCHKCKNYFRFERGWLLFWWDLELCRKCAPTKMDALSFLKSLASSRPKIS